MTEGQGFSPRFLELLRSTGWFEGRRVRVVETVEALRREGFEPHALAVSLLESLAGLMVRLPPAGVSPYEHELRFDALRAATGERDRAEDWEAHLGVRLFPIGEEVTSGNVIWVGSDARFYYGRGLGLLYLLGNSIAEAMDQLAFPTRNAILVAGGESGTQ